LLKRTLSNLEHLDRLAKDEESRDVLPERRTAFPVTQLINSLLGLVVFPKENYSKAVPEKKLADLIDDGWPQVEISYPSPSCSRPKRGRNHKRCETLNELVRVLRNGTSHFNIEFKNNPGTEQIEVISFSNRCPDCEKLTTTVRLSIHQVRDIAGRYSRLIIEHSEKEFTQGS
jgi:hypothetical protein